MRLDYLESDELIKEITELNRKLYGYEMGNAKTLGIMQAHVGFLLSTNDPEFQQKQSTDMLQNQLETLMVEYLTEGDYNA